MFGGVRENDRLARARCGGEALPCTFELLCIKRYVMSAEEVRAQETLQRNIDRERERRRASRRAERATVESVTDEDDPDAGSSSSEEERGRSRGSRTSRRG